MYDQTDPKTNPAEQREREQLSRHNDTWLEWSHYVLKMLEKHEETIPKLVELTAQLRNGITEEVGKLRLEIVNEVSSAVDGAVEKIKTELAECTSRLDTKDSKHESRIEALEKRGLALAVALLIVYVVIVAESASAQSIIKTVLSHILKLIF